MARPVTLFTGQWADLPLEELAAEVRRLGLRRARARLLGRPLRGRPRRSRTTATARGSASCSSGTASAAGRSARTSSARRSATAIDERHRAILPPEVWGDGDPEGVRRRAAERMKDTARAAARLGVTQVNGFTGSSIWHLLYSFPPNDFAEIERGYEEFAERWSPIIDVFDAEGVRFGARGAPDRDRLRLRDDARRRSTRSANREAFGINLDPCHFAHQFLDSAQFALEFADRIYHVHVKDSKRRLDGRRSILGSHLELRRGGARAGTSSRRGTATSTSRSFFRALNRIGYAGAALDRVGGLRDGPRLGRAGRARVRAAHRLRPVRRGLRRGDAEGASDEREARSESAQRARRRSRRRRRRSASGCSATPSWARRTRTPTSTLPYMTWPPPLRAAARRDRRAQRGGGRRRPRGATGSSAASTDWRELVADPAIGLFDNGGPNTLHAEPTIAAAEAGKHVICEKPLGRDADESYEIWQRVAATGVKHMCAFNYRFVPAVRLAREMIEAGELGEIRHFRGRYLQEWGDDPTLDIWRFDADEAGSGALGDLGAHVIDLARYLVGEIASGLGARRGRSCPGREVDDAIEAVVAFESGAVGTIEASRFALGRKNAFQLGDQRLEGLARVRPRAPQRAPGTSARTATGPAAGRPCSSPRPTTRSGSFWWPPRAHHRLGAHLRARDPPPAARDPRGRRGRAARSDVRGRLPRRRGVRRDRPLLAEPRAGGRHLPLSALARPGRAHVGPVERGVGARHHGEHPLRRAGRPGRR